MNNNHLGHAKEQLKNLEETFSDWGRREPYYSVLTDERFLSHNISDRTLDDFYSLGELDIFFALEILKHNRVAINPAKALDFGCGVGRLTLALVKIFHFVIGCDISEPHLEVARSNANQFGINNVHFIKNNENLLNLFQPESFNFIYSRLALQHIPQALSKAYIRQFTALLKVGGYSIFQLPTKSPEYTCNPEAFSVSEVSHNIHMYSVEIREVLESINEGNCQLIDLVLETDRDGWSSHLFLIKKQSISNVSVS